jgi:hypothetical protein
MPALVTILSIINNDDDYDDAGMPAHVIELAQATERCFELGE